MHVESVLIETMMELEDEHEGDRPPRHVACTEVEVGIRPTSETREHLHSRLLKLLHGGPVPVDILWRGCRFRTREAMCVGYGRETGRSVDEKMWLIFLVWEKSRKTRIEGGTEHPRPDGDGSRPAPAVETGKTSRRNHGKGNAA